MRKSKPRISGWLLDEAQRVELLREFPPAYAEVIAHHVTLAFGIPGKPKLSPERSGTIVGLCDDGAGVQALVVEVGGTTTRPDGGTYHVTWSIDRKRGRKPVDSNTAIAEHGWTSCPRVPLSLRPASF